MIDEESELMRRVAQGDESAFAPLVERVLPRLLGYFRRLGADRTTAEDCAQDVLLKVYRVRSTYSPRARFVTFLFHVARNHWIDVYRHRRAGPTTFSSDAGWETPEGVLPECEARAPAEEPGARADLVAFASALSRAVAALGEEHREVFVLAQVEGLRYAEIARILRIPVGTVKSRMHAATRDVREALAREGFEP